MKTPGQSPAIELDRSQKRDIKQGHAKILTCAHCGKPVFYGAMGLVSIAISKDKPSCAFDCNVSLGQVRVTKSVNKLNNKE